MDYWLKGHILNCTLKSYSMSPIESVNVCKVRMKSNGDYKHKSPSKRRWDKVRKEKFLAKYKRDPLLAPIPFLEPDQSLSHCILIGPVCAVIATAFITQAEDMVQEIKDLGHQCDHPAQEWERLCNQVHDLRLVVKGELERLQQDLSSKKGELTQLEGRKKIWRPLAKSHACGIIQCLRVVKGCFGWAKCTQKEEEE